MPSAVAEGVLAGHGRAMRFAEMVVLFVVAPTVIALVMPGRLVFPAIWLLCAVCLAVLLPDTTFDRGELFRARGIAGCWRTILVRAAVIAAALTVLLWLVGPEMLFRLPRERPARWAFIMAAYPVLSVYPQEVAFRCFFRHRYRALFVNPSVHFGVNAVAFGFAHVIMHNWIAIVFSAVGGVLLAHTYDRTRSVFAVFVEHAAYGCALFTIGWGSWFYFGLAGR